ncbi:MAG: type I phosphomannose isomerase catalytic subunit [Pirellulales bacterium]
MTRLYPLRFEPIFRRYLWGGRRLGEVLDKDIGHDSCAESWEVVDHGADQSIVRNGPLTGMTLRALTDQHGAELLGVHHPQTAFPLLWKFVDAQQPLSVQVHPNDAQAAQLDPPDLGKTEAWVVLAAEPGSVIYAGLKPGFDCTVLRREISRGTCERCLHCFEPQVGDCVFIPAGTVHALGAGLLVGEIQQASDTTYRLYDWNRLGPDGEARELHVEQGLEVIDFQRGPVALQTVTATDHPNKHTLVSCEKFILNRWQFDREITMPADKRCHIIACVEGSVTVLAESGEERLGKGGTMLLPATIGAVRWRAAGPTVLLDAFLP